MSLKNQATLIGRAGGEPRHFKNDNFEKASFSLATSEYRPGKDGEKGTEYTEWHEIECYNGLSKVAMDRVKKGSAIIVRGKIETRESNYTYTGSDGTERKVRFTTIRAERIDVDNRKMVRPED